MESKKELILKLSEQTEPKLSRAEIARQAKCSTPYVTQTLGAVRPYKARQETVEPEKVIG